MNNNGVGFFGWLTLIFVVAKLTGLVQWSWWLVFAPFWIPLAIILCGLVVIALLAALSK